MNSKTLQNLQHRFLGKVCSVFTKPINRPFDEVHWREHFCIRVEEITPDGIWGTHPYNGTVSFFFLSEVIFIQEEIELDPTNPEHAKMIKEFEERTGEKIVSDVSPHLAPVVEPEDEEPTTEEEPTAFVDIEALKELASMSKRLS